MEITACGSSCFSAAVAADAAEEVASAALAATAACGSSCFSSAVAADAAADAMTEDMTANQI